MSKKVSPTQKLNSSHACAQFVKTAPPKNSPVVWREEVINTLIPKPSLEVPSPLDHQVNELIGLARQMNFGDREVMIRDARASLKKGAPQDIIPKEIMMDEEYFLAYGKKRDSTQRQ